MSDIPATAVSPEPTRHQAHVIARMLMEANGVSLGEVAAALGLTKSRVSERLTGKTRITVDELAVMAELFDVEPGVFFLTPREIFSRSRKPAFTDPRRSAQREASQVAA